MTVTQQPDGPAPAPTGSAGAAPGPGEVTGPLLREGTDRLVAAGSETPRLDAEVLLGHAVGVGRTVVLAHPEAPVGADAARRYRADIARRATGEPVAYIRGLKEFYGLAFETDARALIPRPETERLVELAAAEVMGRLTTVARPVGTAPLRVADVGTGSGAVGVALAVALRKLGALEAVDILATDVSSEALGLARENAVGHAVADRVVFVEADLLPDGTGPFDVVVANLPYVRTDVIPTLPRASSFEPILALDGGPDGLAVIERLLALLPVVVVADGVALLEIGSDQADAIGASVTALLPGWSCTVEDDLSGLPRVARIGRA
ncbi:MAG: peptide chain release factor N(5)-glutamine methyltransferase [Chloroflexota bacterium]